MKIKVISGSLKRVCDKIVLNLQVKAFSAASLDRLFITDCRLIPSR